MHQVLTGKIAKIVMYKERVNGRSNYDSPVPRTRRVPKLVPYNMLSTGLATVLYTTRKIYLLILIRTDIRLWWNIQINVGRNDLVNVGQNDLINVGRNDLVNVGRNDLINVGRNDLINIK